MKIKCVGFTLLEVLVALTVISIGMTAALAVTDSSIDVISDVERRTYANWMAENLVAELTLNGVSNTGNLEGKGDMAGREWFWQADVKPTSDDDVLKLRIKVSAIRQFDIPDADVHAYLRSKSL